MEITYLCKRYGNYIAEGKTPIVFTVKDGEKNIFVGMLLLQEGIDTTVASSVSALRRNGVKIITFSNCVGRTHAPEIPTILRKGGRAYAGDFLRHGYTVTHGFGSYDEYCGFDANMIFELAKYIKEQGKSLAVLGFSDYAPSVIEQADLFISCTPIEIGANGYFGEEIRSLEMSGEQSSASCTQEVKSEAEILLMRPCDARGGLEPLARAIEFCKSAYTNLRNFIVYIICVQIMRLIAVAFPMLFGNSVADARQLLFFGLLDMFAMLIFMYDPRRSVYRCRNVKNEISSNSIVDIVKKNSLIMICAAVGSAVALLLPNLMALVGWFGSYVCKSEFTFISLGLMQITALLLIYSRNLGDIAGLKRMIKSKIAMIGAGLFVVFTTLCLLTPMGDLFGIESIGLFYLLFSIVPVAAQISCFIILNKRK